MAISRYSTRSVVALLVCVSALSCNGGSHTTPGGEDAQRADNGQQPVAPGAPGGNGGDNGNNGAPGAPIKIPDIVNTQGFPIDEIEQKFVDGETPSGGTHIPGLQELCGGTLCVTITREARDRGVFTKCQFVETDPSVGTMVARGSTIVMVTGILPCADDSSQPTDDTPSAEPTDTAPESEPAS
jgi:hypothetical protein